MDSQITGMNVGINLLFLKPGLVGGTETYTRGMLEGFAAINEEGVRYYVFCSSDFDTSFIDDNKSFTVIKFNRVTRSLAYRYFFEQFIFPFKLKKYKLNVLHSFGYIGPLFAKHHLVTIHDANAFAHKNTMPFGKRILLSGFLKVIAKTCRHIITVSFFSKQEIIKHLGANEAKISVVYEACKFNDGNAASLPAKYEGLRTVKYFIALSSTSHHKNIITLVRAFKQVYSIYPSCKLVLVGLLPYDNSISQYIQDENLQQAVVLTGFVDDATLMALLANAFCFVFPSLYEGFGLPLLEAQKAGLPVIASNMGSLPEIGGDSAIYFNATDDIDLAEKMKDMMNDEAKRQLYIQKGAVNVKRFSWQKAAAQTLRLYQRYRNIQQLYIL